MAPAAKVDEQTIPSCVLPPPTQPSSESQHIEQPIHSHELPPNTEPGNTIAGGLRPGYEPEQITCPHATISQEGREAFDDTYGQVFTTQRKAVGVNVTYYQLHETTSV